MTKNRCKLCDMVGDSRLHQFCQLEQQLAATSGNSASTQGSAAAANLIGGLYLQQLKDMMLAAYLLKGYYQPAGPLIQHPPPLQVKGPPPDSTPTPPQNSEGSDDLVATSTTSGGTTSTGGGFYRGVYCPQYYATPPQYQDLCYPPSYSHSHPHPPPYYHKYAPPYRRPYYTYQEPGANGGPGGSGPPGPGIEYQPPPGEYMSYYPGYPPPPPPPPPPNPAYLHSQGRPFAEHAFQSCPCPMQSCPKNADTGPLIGNGKGAPVATGPGLSLPPSALVGPPSPARGLAGAPPHGANAWVTDRVQINPAHRSLTQKKHNHHDNHQNHHHLQQQQPQQQQQQQLQSASTSTARTTDCKGEKDCLAEGKLRSGNSSSNTITTNGTKCACNSQSSTKRTAMTSSTSNSGCSEVKLEQSISPAASDSAASTATSSSPDDKLHQLHHHHHTHDHHHHHHSLKLENNNVKCESCSSAERRDDSADDDEDDDVDRHRDHQRPPRGQTHIGGCRVKCEAGYKCEIMKCEQCVKEAGQLAINEMDKDSGILEDDAGSGKVETDTEVKEELGGITETSQWKKPDYEPTAAEPEIEENEKVDNETSVIEEQQQSQQLNGQKVGKRKLSLDSLSDFAKLKRINKRTMSVGSPRDFGAASQQPESNSESAAIVNGHHELVENGTNNPAEENTASKDSTSSSKKKNSKTENQSQKRNFDGENPSQPTLKKLKKNPKTAASETSIMETINNVVMQSLLMAEKATKTKKSNNKNNKGKVEKKNKKNSVLLTTVKTATKNLDIVKAAVTQKLEFIKNEFNKGQQKINSKVEAKIKSKVQNVKNSKVKAKMIKVKSKVLESKISSNKLSDIKNSKITDSKPNKIVDQKNTNKTVESKSKTPEPKNLCKPIEPKCSKQTVETKSQSKTPEPKIVNKPPAVKNSKSKVQESKEVKDMKEIKESKVTLVSVPIISPTPKIKEPKAAKLKDCPKKIKAIPVASLEIKKYKKKGGKGTKKSASRRESFCKIEERNKEPTGKCLATILKKPFLKPKWSNGWNWEGEPFQAKVYLTNEESAIRRCYASMKHENGDVLRPRDCVLLRSGARKGDLPFVAKIAALWENPEDGEMMFSLLWYYRPEHTEQGRTEYDTDDEVFASRHRDANSVACIEDKCYILTFNEYCRYRKSIRRIEEGLDSPGSPRVNSVPPGNQQYPRESRQPRIPIAPDMVLFCRRVYDYRGKKLVKNPG